MVQPPGKTEPGLLGPKDHINIRISHFGSKAQYTGDTRNTVWYDPHVCVVFLGLRFYPTVRSQEDKVRRPFWIHGVNKDEEDEDSESSTSS